jgi:hypothetical protein
MILDRQFSSKNGRHNNLILNFFKTKYIIVNHHCCQYQVMFKNWYLYDWKVKPLKNGVNQFYDIHSAIEWINNGCPIDNEYITTVIWEF